MDVDAVLRNADPVRFDQAEPSADLANSILGRDDAVSPMPGRPSRQLPRLGRTTLTLALVAVSLVVSLLLGSLGGSPVAHRPPAHRAADGASDQRGSFAIGVATLLPATSKELYGRDGNVAMMGFLQEVWEIRANSCLRAAGFTAPRDLIPIAHVVAIPYDNTQFPDIALYRTGRFDAKNGVMARPSGKGPTAAAALEQSVCLKRATDATMAPVEPLLGQLGNDWTQLSSAVYSSRPVRLAWSKWDTCVRAGGVRVSNYDQFFGLADEATGLPGYSHSAARVSYLARLFGRCIPPVVAALDSGRLALRQSLLAKNQKAMVKLEAEMSALIRHLSAVYRLPYPPPLS